MKLFKQGRYSGFLRPIFYTIDLLLINSVAFFVCFDALFSLTFAVVISLSWIIISFVSRFYEVISCSRVFYVLVQFCCLGAVLPVVRLSLTILGVSALL